jgi:hypothetical protein
MLLGLSESLSKIVLARYAHAKSVGSLIFSDSETAIIPIRGGASVSSIYTSRSLNSYLVIVSIEILPITLQKTRSENGFESGEEEGQPI